jgi:NAD-dependent dihydropyrimidine dehydrogenase PreA subunit
MICYFSGTGNSRWVAEQLAAQTGDTTAAIADLMRDGPVAVAASGDSCIGVVFPIYAWGVPKIVERFLKGVRVSEGAYAYAVCTCGDEAGNAMKRLRRIFPFAAAWSVKMPNNYLPMYDVDDEQTVRDKIAAARKRVEAIAACVNARRSAYDVYTGGVAFLKTAVVCPAFNAFALRTKPFFASDACNGCKLCEQNCPIGAIAMQNEKPVWVKKNCTQCMACIQRCPQRAIQYGRGTEKKGRYWFREDL